jgi:hypothetical protein
MSDKIDYLKFKLYEWQEMHRKNIEFTWELPKELICMMADLIKDIAKHLPDHLKWLQDLLLMTAQILIALCQSIPLNEAKGIQYANTR